MPWRFKGKALKQTQRGKLALQGFRQALGAPGLGQVRRRIPGAR